MTQAYLGALESARDTHEQALRVVEQAYGMRHTVMADVLNNYAAVLHQQGKYGRGDGDDGRQGSCRDGSLCSTHHW